jgi:hypothetical protein
MELLQQRSVLAVIDTTDDQSNAEHKHVWSNFSLV